MLAPARETRAVLALALAGVLLLSPTGGPAWTLLCAVAPLLPAEATGDVGLGVVAVVLGLAVLLLARSGLRRTSDGPPDGWHRLAAAAGWLAALQVLLGFGIAVGLLPGSGVATYGWTAY